MKYLKSSIIVPLVAMFILFLVMYLAKEESEKENFYNYKIEDLIYEYNINEVKDINYKTTFYLVPQEDSSFITYESLINMNDININDINVPIYKNDIDHNENRFVQIKWNFKKNQKYKISFSENLEKNSLKVYNNINYIENSLAVSGKGVENAKIIFNTNIKNEILEIGNSKRIEPDIIKDINKVSENKYEIYLKNMNKKRTVSIAFDAYNKEYKLKYPKEVITQDLNISKIYKNYQFERIIYISIILVIGIILFIITKIINNKIINHERVVNETVYYRDVENLIQPDLAEFLINKKFDLGNYIITTIFQLERKNVLKINKDNITIINRKNDLTENEKSILDILFDEDSMTIEIKNIVKKVQNYADNTSYAIFKEIEKNVKIELYNQDYLSKKHYNFCRIIKNIESLLLINIVIFVIFWISHSLIVPIALNLFLIPIYMIFKKEVKNLGIRRLFNINNLYIFVPLCAIVPPLIAFAFYQGGEISLELIYMLISFAILLLIKYSKIEIYKLTERGIAEREKILGLKKFLEDNSMIKYKKMQDIVLWEDYLIYASAFGIFNKDMSIPLNKLMDDINIISKVKNHGLI